MPSLQHLHLVALAAGGHRFALKMLPSSKLKYVYIFGCGIRFRLLRKIVVGQSLLGVAFRPDPAQIEEITGSDISVPDLLASLTDSKLSLKKLTLFPMGIRLEYSSLLMFKNLEALEVPYAGVLDIPRDETDPKAIYALLADQLPANLTHISLRYLAYDIQTKVIIGQLALLKTRKMFSRLDMARFIFYNAVAFPSIAQVLSIGGPTGALDAGTIWDPLPNFVPKVQEEFGKLYKEAGIYMLVKQSDY
ncbi:hypothetical protein G6011_00489 [Alternaria panax]|uniref:Uncharacterized protein n=1 Tax=Alternaria panax TaxID=48097 RepID=A0AAD4NV17_9PLEO|nr:hypothetical protein G6011_00489 [Alternaria panax]